MKCNICNKQILKCFGSHLNVCHKVNCSTYFQENPEQLEDYKKMKPVAWNKGMTKENNPVVARIADKIKNHTQQDHIRKERSERLKKLYEERGDIVTPEQRIQIIKSGSDGWVKKINSCSQEEKNKLLANFVSAGNNAQKEKRHLLTPEDYQERYPWALGKAKYHECDNCSKEIIIWLGGRPRPKKRFCSNDCRKEYQRKHPFYVFSDIGTPFYSSKMKCEFYLRSNYEIWFAEQLDKQECVDFWSSANLTIPYFYEDKERKYYPDFTVNENTIIEIKSSYTYAMDAKKTTEKIKAAKEYAESNGFKFFYWQFDEKNMSRKKFLSDIRIKDFFKI
jgi:hypothetical protein